MYLPEKFQVQDGKMVLLDDAPHPTRQKQIVKLIQNIYGLANASYTWHQHLKKILVQEGFSTSQVDPCLFYRSTLMFILYVDDAICLTPKKKKADLSIDKLQVKRFILTDKGPLSVYMRLQVKALGDGSIEISQPGFILQIIESVRLKDQCMHNTPANEKLHCNKNGAPKQTDFHYRSVTGQLNYLAGTTRPEIQFAVHQCACFCKNPKASHKQTVKRIIRYLH